MWFKNAIAFKCNKEFISKFSEVAEGARLVELQPNQAKGVGLVNALGDELVYHGGGVYLFSVVHQERKVPYSVVKEELEKVIKKIEAEGGRKVSSREKKDIKESIEFELMKKAFIKKTQIDAIYIAESELLIINASSEKKALIVTGLIRKVLGSFECLPFGVDSLDLKLTNWLLYNELRPFDLGLECDLVGGDGQEKAKFTKHDIDSDLVIDNLKGGKVVRALGLGWQGRVSFKLHTNCTLSKIKFLDVLEKELMDKDPQSTVDTIAASLQIMAKELDIIFLKIKRLDKNS